MKFTYGKAGGLVIQTRNHVVCIFPANVRFAKAKRVIIIFGVGFSFNRTAAP